jgi:hypothetical protein
VWFAAGAFQGAAATEQTVDRLAESFRTGGGLSFDDFGPAAAAKVKRTLGPLVAAGPGTQDPARPDRRHRTAGSDGYDPSEHAINRVQGRVWSPL